MKSIEFWALKSSSQVGRLWSGIHFSFEGSRLNVSHNLLKWLTFLVLLTVSNFQIYNCVNLNLGLHVINPIWEEMGISWCSNSIHRLQYKPNNLVPSLAGSSLPCEPNQWLWFGNCFHGLPVKYLVYQINMEHLNISTVPKISQNMVQNWRGQFEVHRVYLIHLVTKFFLKTNSLSKWTSG